jgi:hypothetical protein
MNFEILNVNESPLFDTTIAYAEKRTHPPYASSSFTNNDEIRIPIQQQDTSIYTLLWYSSLHVQGKVEVRNDINVLIESPDVRFVNMGILFLFNEIRLEVAGDVVDGVRNPRIMSVMKGYVTYNTGQSKALENGGWIPKARSTLIDKTTGLFDAIIPLRTILGLCADFKKIVLNSRQELVLVRSNTDNNAFIFDDVDATTRSAKVLIHKIAWRVHLWLLRNN